MTTGQGKTAAVVGSVLTWDMMALATNLDAGAIATAITIVGGSVIGLIVLGIQSISRALIQKQKEWVETNRESLLGDLEKARDDLMELQDQIKDDHNRIASLEVESHECKSDRDRLRHELHESDERLSQVVKAILEEKGVVVRQTQSTTLKTTITGPNTPDPDAPPVIEVP